MPPAKAELVTGELWPPKGMSKPYPRDPMGVTFCGDRLFAHVMTGTWGLHEGLVRCWCPWKWGCHVKTDHGENTRGRPRKMLG